MNLYFSSQFYVGAALILGVLTLLCGAAANHLKERNTARIDKKHQAEILEKSDEIAVLSAEVIRLQGDGIDELKHQTGLLTGGNSFPIIVFSPFEDGDPTIVVATLYVRGRYPLRDISWQIRISDADGTHRSVGNIDLHRPLRPMALGKLKIKWDNQEVISATILIQANNGNWGQKIDLRLDENGKIESKFLVQTDDLNRTTLLEVEYGKPVPFGTMEQYQENQYRQ